MACEANAIKKLSEIILKSKTAQILPGSIDEVSSHQADMLKEARMFIDAH